MNVKVIVLIVGAIIFLFAACRVTQRDVEAAVARCMQVKGDGHPECLEGREVCKDIRCGPCTQFLNTYPWRAEITIPLGSR